MEGTFISTDRTIKYLLYSKRDVYLFLPGAEKAIQLKVNKSDI
jgi:hypothetical protein